MTSNRLKGVLAFAFGAPESIESNMIIGRVTEILARGMRARIFTQLDVPIDENDLEVRRATEVSGNPPPTLRIAREAIQWALSENIGDLHIVAATPHLWRATRDTYEAVRERQADIHTAPYSNISSYPDGKWFCKDSNQPWTQCIEKWERREWILRHMPLWLYKKVAR